MENPIKMDDLGVPLFLETPTWIHEWLIFIYTLVNDHIAGWNIPPSLIGNKSTQSGAPIFQPAILDYRSVSFMVN